MNRDEAHLRDRLLMLAESTAPHIPFNVKRKSSQKPGLGRNGPKLSVQDVVRMDPGYTPDIQHLVFPAKKRGNPQQVAAAPANTNSSGKTRSRLAEMFALSRHLQQRSVDRDVKPRTSMLNRSVDGSLEPRHTAPRSAAAADISQRWLVEEPVRHNTSTRVSPAKETDMATTRGPNVSVLHLRGSDPWDTSPTAAVFTTNSTRSYSSSRSSYNPLTKHQSLGGYNKNYNQYNPNSNSNSSEIYLGGTCSRELSPVRWCDQEVDGVYLGRSGWVQVHQRSFDENRRGHYATSDSLQPSRRIGIKLADYHCKSEPGPPEESTKEVQRPAYLPLRSREYDIPKAKTPSPMRVPENFSPPSVTPIISPPPAFQDRNQKMKTRTFFGKPPFLPRSNAIVDSDVSPPLSPKTWSAPRKPKTSPIVEHVRSYPRIPQTKSLEDTTATRRTQFVQKYGESSSSSSGSMGFRSLDSYVPRVAMPRLSENTDSSLDVYEDADDEDNNSSSINMSIVNVEVHQTREVHQSRTTKDKVSPSNRQPRTPYRVQRRSPGNSDSNRQSGCNSPTSSTSSSGNEFPSPNVQVRRSAPARQYQTPEEQSIRVRRSRSLQLPDKKPTVGYRNPSVKISPQPDSHRVVVKIGGSKRNEEVLSEDMLKEAEVVTGFLYGSRSKAAAQALLMQRYNNVREEANPEPPKPNNGYNVYIVNKKEKKLQRGLTAPAPSKKPTPVEVKPQYPGDACDFWPHCTHRILTSPNSNQSMMKISHSYPTHQRSLDHSSPEVPQRVHPKNEPQKRLARADTEIKYTNVMASSSASRFGDNMRRLSPNKSVCERRSSPVNRGLSPQSRNPSSSSTSSDVYLTTSSRSPKNAKSSGASTPMEEVPERDKAVREIVLTRPGSAPSDENKPPGFVDAQQRSMSLPKSFLSGTYQQACQIPWRKKGADSLTTSPGLNRRTIASKAQTAPVTPLHDSNRRRSPLGGASARKAKANSSPQLLDPLHTDHSKWEDDRPETTAEIRHRINPKDFSRGRSLPGPTTESVLQKFRKTFSLRFQKKGSKECCSTDLGDNLAEIPTDHCEEDSVLHLQSVSPCNTLAEAKDDHSEQKYKFGPLVWRSSKERKKLNKAARNAKCNSGDSGIQIEMAPNCGDRTGGDSSESHDTDQPCDDLDSPPVRRRAAGHHPANGRAARPHSDLINQILIDKFKAELKSRAHRRPCVRRTHSDLGGQRILHWEARSSYRRLMASPAAIKGRPQSPRKRPPDLPDSVQLRTNSHRRGQLRRSLSQPLDIDKLSPLMKLKATGFRNGGSTVVSEDEQDRGTSDDDMMSDSESSVASLSDRKKSLELAMDEDMVILAEAVFDHVAIEAEELAFRAGDVIEVQTTSNRDWWWGGCDGRTGWFPAAFVRLRVSQEDTVEDCLAAMASGRSVPSQLRRRTSVSLLSNDQVRTSVVRELVHTERDFVKVLQDVVEGYIAECRKRSDMFSDDQINAIFINLEEILKFQTGFLKDLESSIDWDFPHKSCVGSCFMKHKEGFTMYSDYCNSHPIATATLQELYRFNSYSKFFEACRLMRGLIEIPLDGYLLTPVQRICKYPLQLAELLKYTKVEHADYAHIREALEAMRGVAVLINERKRRMESLEKLAAWQQRVEGWEGEDLIEKSSQLIHQGEIIRVTTGVWTSNLTLFLFDHQLVYCKKDILKRNTYVYKGRIHLDTTEVIDVPDGKDTHIGVTVRHAIRLYSVIRDKWLLFCCRSASEKKRWLEAFAEERSHVARDKSEGIEFPSAAKQLARVASRCQRRPPRKPGGGKHYKMESPYIGSMLHLNSQNSNSLGRKVGTWFTFGGNKKTRHQQRDVS